MLLALGGIALFGACELEPPLGSELDAELEAEQEASDGLVDELEADSTPVANNCGNCRDGDGGTYDWCSPADECKHKERWKCEDEGSYCNKDKDCLDGKRHTVDWCYKRSCHHANRWSGKCDS